MRYNQLVLPFFIFLFLLLSSHGLAYTVFSYNPKINADVTGLVFVSQPDNITYSYNATCNGESGCLFVDSNYSGGTEAIWIFTSQQWQPTFPQQWNTPTDFISYSNSNGNLGGIVLPANEEGIFFIRYRTNNSFSNQPYMYIEDNQGHLLLSQNLTSYTGTNTWYNATIFLNASASSRIIYPSVEFLYDTGGTDAQLQIDQFKFYTLDIDESRTIWTSNETYERIRYCGEDATAPSTVNLMSASSHFSFYNYDNNRSFLQCEIKNDPSNPILSGAFQTGTLTRARRYIGKDMAFSYTGCPTYSSSGDEGYALLQMRDMFFGYYPCMNGGCGCNPLIIKDYFLIEGNLLTTIKLSPLTNLSNQSMGELYNKIIMVYDGTPNEVVVFQNLTDGLFRADNNNYTLQHTIDKTPFNMTATPAGTNWKMCQSYDCGTASNTQHFYNPSSYYPFFQPSTLTCLNRGWSCDANTNNETYTDSSCNITQQNYCGSCGCGATRCAYPSVVGTYCDVSDSSQKSYVTTSSSCTNTTGSCGTNEVCNQFTLTLGNTSSPFYTISCYNTVTAQNDYCVNTTGSQVNCSDITTQQQNIINNQTSQTSQQLQSSGNWYGVLALFVASSMFGITDVATAESFMSLLISIIISVSLVVYLSLNQKGEAHLGQIFLGSNISILFLFTIGGMFNMLFFVALFVLDLSIMSGLLQRLVGIGGGH